MSLRFGTEKNVKTETQEIVFRAEVLELSNIPLHERLILSEAHKTFFLQCISLARVSQEIAN